MDVCGGSLPTRILNSILLYSLAPTPNISGQSYGITHVLTAMLSMPASTAVATGVSDSAGGVEDGMPDSAGIPDGMIHGITGMAGTTHGMVRGTTLGLVTIRDGITLIGITTGITLAGVVVMVPEIVPVQLQVCVQVIAEEVLREVYGLTVLPEEIQMPVPYVRVTSARIQVPLPAPIAAQ